MATKTLSATPTSSDESCEHSGTPAASNSSPVDEEKGSEDGHQLAPELVITAQDWTGPDDPECPHNWTVKKRVYITSVLSLYAFTVTFASSIYTAGDRDIQERFKVGPTTALLGLSIFVWGLAFGPVISAPLSEIYGRKIVLLGTFPIFGLFTLGTGLAQNFATILICRFFAGVFGSTALAVGSGTSADIWPPKYSGVTYPFQMIAPFLGPTTGPVVGGFVAAHKDFRWLQWVILFTISGCYIWSLPMPETYKRRLLQRRAKRLGLTPPPSRVPEEFVPAVRFFFFVTILKPVKMLFTESIVLALTIWISFNFAVVYSTFSAFPYVFSTVYHFDGPQIGLTFIPLGIGVILGFLVCIIIDKMTYSKLRKRYEGSKVPPEYRLLAPCVGGFLLPISLFWFGWTADKGVSWPCPLFAAIFFGMGSYVTFNGGAIYFIDAYGMANGASAISANGLLRYAAAGALPLVTRQMYSALGIGWASSLLGFVSVALVPLPFIFFRFGHRIRARSAYIEVPKS